VAFAHRTDVEQVLMFHHDPLHSDTFLDDVASDVAGRLEALGRPPEWAGFACERHEFTVGRIASGEPAAS
jgi:hypothetical protein